MPEKQSLKAAQTVSAIAKNPAARPPGESLDSAGGRASSRVQDHHLKDRV